MIVAEAGVVALLEDQVLAANQGRSCPRGR